MEDYPRSKGICSDEMGICEMECGSFGCDDDCGVFGGRGRGLCDV
jgi:hypothetical protein